MSPQATQAQDTHLDAHTCKTASHGIASAGVSRTGSHQHLVTLLHSTLGVHTHRSSVCLCVELAIRALDAITGCVRVGVWLRHSFVHICTSSHPELKLLTVTWQPSPARLEVPCPGLCLWKPLEEEPYLWASFNTDVAIKDKQRTGSNWMPVEGVWSSGTPHSAMFCGHEK